MTTAIAPVEETAISTEALEQRTEDYRRASRSASTLRAYTSDVKDFAAWCKDQGLTALPAAPRTIAGYLTHLIVEKGRKVSTLQRRVAAIGKLHEVQGEENPCKDAAVREVMADIRRAHGTAQEGKAPVRTDDLRRMIERLPSGLLAIRDRALLLVGFAGAFRRSEVVGLDVSDVEVTREGLVVTIRKSKTDQEGEGRRVGIPYGSNPLTCPVRAVEHWLEASGLEQGPLFRSVNRHGQLQPSRLSSKAVALVVKRSAERVGLDPARFAGHSLRAGFATEAASRGVDERRIADQTGHRSMHVLRRYIREGQLFVRNAAAEVGL